MWVTLSFACAAMTWASVRNENVVRAASGADPFRDTDGDLVPDMLEWVVFSDPTRADSDGDGQDDFLEITQHTAPFAFTAAKPFDHEMRLLVSEFNGAEDGQGEIWLHCLFRFASGMPSIDWFLPQIHTTGVSVPIGELFGQTPFRITMLPANGGGSYAVLTMLLARTSEFAHLLPCTVSARASVGGRVFVTGSYVMSVGGSATALMPAGLDSISDRFMLQTLSDSSSSSSFFRRNKVCEMELAVIGSTPGGHICEVNRAACEPANGLKCNVSCDQSAGAMIFVPDGLTTITGG